MMISQLKIAESLVIDIAFHELRYWHKVVQSGLTAVLISEYCFIPIEANRIKHRKNSFVAIVFIIRNLARPVNNFSSIYFLMVMFRVCCFKLSS